MKILDITLLAGMSSVMLLAYSSAIDMITPTLREAVDYQDQTVKLTETLGLTSGPARSQWDQKKPVALARISALEALSDALKTQPTQPTQPTP
jgi:hypothetical protein